MRRVAELLLWSRQRRLRGDALVHQILGRIQASLLPVHATLGGGDHVFIN